MSLYKTLFETPENKWKTGIGGMFLITILLGVVFNYEAGAISVIDETELANLTANIGSGSTMELQSFEEVKTESGYVQENSFIDVPETIERDKLQTVECRLTWTDEPSQYFQGTNEPDELGITIIAPNGEESDTDSSTGGSVSVSFQLPDYEEDKEFEEKYMGEWTFRVEAGNCGDDSSRLGFRTTADNGNDWNLEYSYTYMDNPPEQA
jgi:hypothetical protein